MRATKSLLLVLLVLAGGLMLGGPAGASDGGWTDGVYRYRGMQHGGPGPGPINPVVTCTHGTCILAMSFTSRLRGTSVAYPVVDGKVVKNLPHNSKVCTWRWPAMHFDFTVTPQRISGSESVEPIGPVPYNHGTCRDLGGQSTYTATIVSAPRPVSQGSRSSGRRAGSPSGSAANPAVTGSGQDVSLLSTGAADAPSVLSGLPRATDVQAKGVLLGIAVAVILVLLVAFPTTLLNSAAEQGTDRISTWWRSRQGPPRAKRHQWWWAASGVLVAGVIASFVDPEFGTNAGSFRTLLSVLVGFLLDVVVGWALVGFVVRRMDRSAVASYSFSPASLLLVAAAVVFTRITDFEPGIVFGLVAGVSFAALTGVAWEAKTALITLGYGFALAALAWIGYSILDAPQGAVAVFVSETLSAVAIAGMAALPIALFPIPGLPGKQVFVWSRPIWAAAYAVGLVAFFVVLMPMPFSWEQVHWSLRTWIGGYLLYLGAAVVAYVLVTRWAGAEPPEPAEPAASEALG